MGKGTYKNMSCLRRAKLGRLVLGPLYLFAALYLGTKTSPWAVHCEHGKRWAESRFGIICFLCFFEFYCPTAVGIVCPFSNLEASLTFCIKLLVARQASSTAVVVEGVTGRKSLAWGSTATFAGWLLRPLKAYSPYRGMHKRF